MAALVALGLALFFLFCFPGYLWPWRWLEHRKQHQEVLKRVNQIPGGWITLRQEAQLMAAQNKTTGFMWRRGGSFFLAGRVHTNYALPPALSALKPQQVDFQPHGAYRGEGSDVEVVAIKIFGMHSTGPGHSIPYFGLEVVWGPGTNNFRPQIKEAASGNGHDSYRKVADNIYEIY